MVLDRDFYLNEDILELSKQLLGKKLCTRIKGKSTSGIIVETEAYKAPEDKASHAYNNHITPRTKTMFSVGGTAYVYVCYGIHHLFNIISAPEGIPHCILIRALKPTEGIDHMIERRGHKIRQKELCNGPGKLSQALGINKGLNAFDLTSGDVLWVENNGTDFKDSDIIAGPRVGMATAEECSNWPWRFRVRNSPWTSKPSHVWYDDW